MQWEKKVCLPSSSSRVENMTKTCLRQSENLYYDSTEHGCK